MTQNAPAAPLGAIEIAGGSITGRDHLGRGSLVVGRNNQDAFGWRRLAGDAGIAAFVCDGCSAGRWSEVGARLGVRLALRSLERRQAALLALEHLALDEARAAVPGVLSGLRDDVLDDLAGLAEALGGDRAETVRDLFLFTMLGAVVTRSFAAVFSLGDGVWAIDGALRRLGPFADNAPPYLGHALLAGEGATPPFSVEAFVPTRELSSILIASDGASDLAAAATELVPGRDEPVGPLSQFWDDDRYLRNPDAIRRRLALINAQVPSRGAAGEPRWRGGLLPDDTTLVVLRRRRPEAP
jgi:hypothetical protein